MPCLCGHEFVHHDYHLGCLKFLCCDRTKSVALGHRHMEHDGADHKAQTCPCNRYTKGDN